VRREWVLLYDFLIDFAIEMLDLIHRTYEADESFRARFHGPDAGSTRRRS